MKIHMLAKEILTRHIQTRSCRKGGPNKYLSRETETSKNCQRRIHVTNVNNPASINPRTKKVTSTPKKKVTNNMETITCVHKKLKNYSSQIIIVANQLLCNKESRNLKN